MHVCEGEDGCRGYPRKYLVQEMFGSIHETKPFSAYWCDDCRLQAEWLYGMSPGEDRPYWWKIEPAGLQLWTPSVTTVYGRLAADLRDAPAAAAGWHYDRLFPYGLIRAVVRTDFQDWRGVYGAY